MATNTDDQPVADRLAKQRLIAQLRPETACGEGPLAILDRKAGHICQDLEDDTQPREADVEEAYWFLKQTEQALLDLVELYELDPDSLGIPEDETDD